MCAIVAVLAATLAADVDLGRTAAIVVDQTNAYRKQQDLPQVKNNPQLQKAADYFARYLADRELEKDEDGLDHEADGQTPAERTEQFGYEYCLVLENIAMYPSRQSYTEQSLADSLAQGWQRSEHHRENLLDPDVLDTAVAIAQSKETGRYYAVQMFGRPESARIEFSISNKAESDATYKVNGRAFTVKAGVTRTHTSCRPPSLLVDLGEDRQKSLQPKAGDVFAVIGEEGKLRVERQ
jgi:uncharacterized protein YkwD